MYFITEVFRAVCQWLTFALPSHALQTWGDDSARVTICRTEVHMVEIYIQSESGETWAATDCQKNWVSILNTYVIILLISSLIGSFLTFTKHVWSRYCHRAVSLPCITAVTGFLKVGNTLKNVGQEYEVYMICIMCTKSRKLQHGKASHKNVKLILC